MRTPYLQQLMQLQPKLTAPISHPHFARCIRTLECLGSFDSGSSLILVTGPSQVGKSLLLQYFVRHLMSEIFPNVPEEERPIIGAAANLAREGRTATKYLYEMLLGDAGSPLHDPRKLVQAVGYRPLRAASEAGLLVALTRAMEALNCRYVIVDEAQFMVRAKNEEFRASLVESIKSLVSYNRTAVLVGGYEVAKVVLEYREHLASRPTVVHFERYTTANGGLAAWRGILDVFAKSEDLRFATDHVLEDHAELLLEECHGQVGVLQHRLVLARARAAALGQKKITSSILQEVRPTTAQWRTIRAAVELGEAALAELVDVKKESERGQEKRGETAGARGGPKGSAAAKRNAGAAPRGQKPFEPTPTRSHEKVVSD